MSTSDYSSKVFVWFNGLIDFLLLLTAKIHMIEFSNILNLNLHDFYRFNPHVQSIKILNKFSFLTPNLSVNIIKPIMYVSKLLGFPVKILDYNYCIRHT